MLQPARTKYRKALKGRIHGRAGRGEILNYGTYGLRAMEPERIIFEVDGVSESVAREALYKASTKLPIKTKFIKRY